jgi:hypothetical protein
MDGARGARLAWRSEPLKEEAGVAAALLDLVASVQRR